MADGLPVRSSTAYSRGVGTASAAATAYGGEAEGRGAEPVIREMRAMPRKQSAARAIQRVGIDEGVTLLIPPPGIPDGHHLAIFPDELEAPVAADAVARRASPVPENSAPEEPKRVF